MAYVQNDLTPEEQQQQQLLQQQQNGGAGLNSTGPTSSSGGLLSSGTAQNPGVTVPSQPAPQSPPKGTGSGFVNLQSYLNANQDQAQNYAGQLGSIITKTGQGAQTAIDSANNQYAGSLTAQSAPYDSGLVSRATENPANFVKNTDDLNKFTAIRDNNYTDPGNFESQPNYGDLATKAKTAVDNSNLLKTEGGRQSLVQKFNPTATRGVNNLDNLLISGNPDAQQTLLKSAQPYAGLQDYLNTTTQGADKTRTAALTNSAANQAQLRNDFILPQSQVLNGVENNLTQRQANSSQEQTQKNKAIQDLQDYIEGRTSAMNYSEAKNFNVPSAIPFLDRTGFTSRARDLILQDPSLLGGPRAKTMTRDQILNQDIQDLTNSVLNNPGRPEYLDLVGGKTLTTTLDNELHNYNNPLDWIRNNPDANRGDDWLEKYFPGTRTGDQAPTISNIASPDEAAKVVALQKLIGGNVTPFLTEDELNQAGTYEGPVTGNFRTPFGFGNV